MDEPLSGTSPYTAAMPVPSGPIADPQSGLPTPAWYRWCLAIYTRTGSGVGIGTGDVQTQAVDAQSTADTAQTEAGAAQVSADAAQATADTAQATADTASTAATAAQTTADTAAADLVIETAARIAADAALLPKSNPVFTGPITNGVGGPTWTHGVGAPVSSVPQGSLYTDDTGAIGLTLYVSRGGGTWLPVVGV